MKKFRTVLAASALAVGSIAASVSPAFAGNVNGIGHHPQPTPTAQHVSLDTVLGRGEACNFPVRVQLQADVKVWQRNGVRTIKVSNEDITVRATRDAVRWKHRPVARPTFAVRDADAVLRQTNIRGNRIEERGTGAQLLLIDRRISRNDAKHASLIYTTADTRSRLPRADRNEILPLVRLRAVNGGFTNVCDVVAPRVIRHHSR